ncbi:MAG: hypothetical protein RLP44_32630 [Aggregatilineales bacterium]
MRNLTRPQRIGVSAGILLAGAYFLLTSLFVVSNSADLLVDLRDAETNVANASLYILSGAVFLFTLVATMTTFRNLGEQDHLRNPSKPQVGLLIVFVGAFLFLCFPMTILTRYFLATAFLLASPFLAVYAGREIAKHIRQKFILSDEELRKAYSTWIVTFLIILGFFQAIG